MIPAGVHALMRVRAFTSAYMHVRVSVRAFMRTCVRDVGGGRAGMKDGLAYDVENDI